MKSIWAKTFQIEELNTIQVMGGAATHLGIEITALGDDWLSGRMPVDTKTQQPIGLLHGGISCALAETLGSIAANLTIKTPDTFGVGQSITASHLRSVKAGFVSAVARPKHLGKKSQVWEIDIRDDQDRPVCFSVLTIAIVSR